MLAGIVHMTLKDFHYSEQYKARIVNTPSYFYYTGHWLSLNVWINEAPSAIGGAACPDESLLRNKNSILSDTSHFFQR